MTSLDSSLWCWRHPLPRGIVVGGKALCIGRTDVPVDPRKARRLARRIRATARREGLPRTVWTSPARRCRAVADALGHLGFEVRVDARLREMDFGRWDGQPWDRIGARAVEAWSQDLLDHAPGGGESLAALARRARAFADEAGRGPERVRLVIGHAGWINALRLVPAGTTRVDAHDWPTGPRHGELYRWPAAADPATPPGRRGPSPRATTPA
jgi:alpha-ribazole phosphatase